MRKFLAAMVMAGLLAIAAVVPAGASENAIRVFVDGVQVEFDIEPQVIDGRTMVPIRAVAEKMGITVDWDESTGTVVLGRGDRSVWVSLNSTNMYIDAEVVVMDVAPAVIGGRTLLPVRYIAQAFGADVQWSQEENAVIISSGGAYAPAVYPPPENRVTLYALDGRTMEVGESEVAAYLNVGWHRTVEETTQTLYAPDGRTITVFQAEVAAYTGVGWYESQSQANAANQAVRGGSSSGNTYHYSSSTNRAPDGYYYRTPTGKRYHLDPDCGGKNSYRTTNIAGLTPCKKCAQ